MIRYRLLVVLMIAMVIGFAGASAQSQQAAGNASPTSAGAAFSDPQYPDKPEAMRRIALYEAAERSVEAMHAGIESTIKVYANLADLYEYEGMYAKADDTMRREIAVLRNGPQGEFADAMAHLAVLHTAMGENREAEKDGLEALRIRESIGEPLGIALAENDLADVDLKPGHYEQALDYARKAMAFSVENPKADVTDQIAVRQTLAYALCGVKQCGQAIPILKEALEMEKSSYGEDSLMVGTGSYLLGYIYWQNGDMEEAAELMGRGTARMKVDLGWGHTIYLNAMTKYAQFLRKRGQTEAAESAEREVKMATAVVDARSLATNSSAFVAHGSP